MRTSSQLTWNMYLHTRRNVPVSGVNVKLKGWKTSLKSDPSKQVQDVIVPSKKDKLQKPANIFKNKIKKLLLKLERRLFSYYSMMQNNFLSKLKVLLRLIYITIYIPRAFNQALCAGYIRSINL